MMNENIIENQLLWKTVFMTVALSLIGVVSKSWRAIALNFDGETIKITAIFYEKVSSEDINVLQNIEAEVVSTHDYMSDLEILLIPEERLISGVDNNWGWVYLRKD